MIGDRVLIRKAGEIIPEIVGVLRVSAPGGEGFYDARLLSSCGTRLHRLPGRWRGAVSTSRPAQLVERLVHRLPAGHGD